MGDFFEKYNQRVKIEGHFGTWLYILGNFLLPKLGIQIKCIFFNKEIELKPENKDVELALLNNISHLTKSDIENLRAFEGDSLLVTFENEFSDGNRCVIARKDGLASACWIAKAPSYLQDSETVTFLIRDCFTLPNLRGQGLYPQILDFAIDCIQKELPHKKVQISVNSIFSNRSSIRGILKSGFYKAGITIQLGKVGFGLLNYSNKRVFRFI